MKISGKDKCQYCTGEKTGSWCSTHRSRWESGLRGERLLEPIRTYTSIDTEFDQEKAREILSKRVNGEILKPSDAFGVNREQKLVQWEFSPRKYKSLEILHLTDLQFGHKAFRADKFEEYRDWILSEPNRFVVYGGDLIDAATVLSVGSPYENAFEPSEQCYRIKELLEPLQPRTLGYVGGNHERRTCKTFGDSGLLIASFLRIPYSSGEQEVFIKYGKHAPFRILLYHGRGASRTKGAKMNVIDDALVKNPDSQLVLIGHLHDAMLTYRWRKLYENGAYRTIKRAAGMSTSFLGYWNTYAEQQQLGFSDTLMIRCILEPSGHWELTLR